MRVRVVLKRGFSVALLAGVAWLAWQANSWIWTALLMASVALAARDVMAKKDPPPTG